MLCCALRFSKIYGLLRKRMLCISVNALKLYERGGVSHIFYLVLLISQKEDFSLPQLSSERKR